MIPRPRHLAPVLVVALSLGLAACGGDGPTSATTPPRVEGDYNVNWTVQVHRKYDGSFQKQFLCHGKMRLVQNPPVGSTSSLTGFAVINSGCELESYVLIGSVSTSGAIELTTSAPKPGWPFCPHWGSVRYSGQIVSTDDHKTSLSMSGATEGACSANRNPLLSSPGFTLNEFTYIVEAFK